MKRDELNEWISKFQNKNVFLGIHKYFALDFNLIEYVKISENKLSKEDIIEKIKHREIEKGRHFIIVHWAILNPDELNDDILAHTEIKKDKHGNILVEYLD